MAKPGKYEEEPTRQPPDWEPQVYACPDGYQIAGYDGYGNPICELIPVYVDPTYPPVGGVINARLVRPGTLYAASAFQIPTRVRLNVQPAITGTLRKVRAFQFRHWAAILKKCFIRSIVYQERTES